MNQEHLDLLRSELWREMLRDHIIPFALDGLTWDDLGADVLEIGPGPGMTTDMISGHVRHLTAVELDIDLASALDQRIGDRVVVRQGDATAMPFPDGRFTAVLSFTMLHHVPTRDLQDRLFCDVSRVLAPGGVFVASDSVASTELAALHDDDIYNPIDPASVGDRLVEAGLTDVHVRSNDFGWAAHARVPSSGRST